MPSLSIPWLTYKIFRLLQRIFIDGIADIDIHQAVIIYINNRNASCPSAHTFYAGFFGNIFKFEIAFIEIQFAGHHIAGEINILQAIIIKISDANSAAIVNIDNSQRVDRIIFGDFVVEVIPE